jgi:tetratricopeptide (TPR) repeat protein
MLLLGSCLFLWSSIRAAEEPQSTYGTPAAQPQAPATGAYGATPAGPASASASLDKVHESYSFPFGAGLISAPGNAASESGRFIDPKAFPDAAYCGHCHQEAYHQWRQSLHSNSFRTPFYRTSVNILIQTKGIEFARHCDSCHNPIAVLSGSLDSHASADRSFDRDGLTCMVCHSIVKVDTRLGNGSYTLGTPAVMVDANGARIPGIVPDSEILMHLDRHSKAVMQDIYKSPQFCSACHKANFPATLNDYKWIRAFTAYDEWQQSKFSQQNPLTFYTADYTTCQGCHMKRAAITLREPGAKHGMFANHSWPAGNTAVPFYYGFQEQMNKTVDFLKSGNYLNVDIFGLKREGEDSIAGPLGAVPFSIKPKDTLTAYVVIQNKLIGHSLIPEVRDLYQAWVQFTVTDATGKSIYRSGFLRPDGTLDPGAHSFTNRPVNAGGTFVDNHKVWTIHSVAYDNSIQAGRSTLVRYQFQLPEGAVGPVTLKAAVEYRHFRQTYLNNVFGPDHPAYPVVELASSNRTISIGDNAAGVPAPTDNPEWMRWNNLAIGYLDELQYADAQHAFEQVARLRPEYKDGYINLAVNDIEWEKYADARAPLMKALSLQPGDARALYYLALVERRRGNSAAEVEDLKRVVAQYPQSRDARRELGISYFQQHRIDDAVAQFKALQAIDPDDLAAHYNLAILYRRLGLKKQASEQAAQYAMKRIDPGAPTYSLDYLRNHPEISNESVPWHIHSESRKPSVSLEPGASAEQQAGGRLKDGGS